MIEAIFHGHSFVEIQSGTERLFIDPFITGNAQCDISLDEAIERKPSLIIVTHGHDDHIGDSVKLAQETGATIVATYECVQWFEEQGIKTCSPQHIGGTVEYDRCRVKFTPALHGGQIDGSSITTTPAGVLVYCGNHTIHHVGDSGLTKEFELLGEFENISVSFVPIGDRFTMGITDAVRALSMIKPKYAVPIHYNTWDVIKADTDTFARETMQQGITVPKILKSGQMVVLD